MPSKTFKIIDPLGLHARPASIVAQTAAKFSCSTTIDSNGKTADLKSIMNIMALGIKKETEVTITTSGEDSEKALEAIGKAMKENKLV